MQEIVFANVSFYPTGVDGHNTPNDKFNRRRAAGHSDVVIDLGEIILEATRQLVNE